MGRTGVCLADIEAAPSVWGPGVRGLQGARPRICLRQGRGGFRGEPSFLLTPKRAALSLVLHRLPDGAPGTEVGCSVMHVGWANFLPFLGFQGGRDGGVTGEQALQEQGRDRSQGTGARQSPLRAFGLRSQAGARRCPATGGHDGRAGRGKSAKPSPSASGTVPSSGTHFTSRQPCARRPSLSHCAKEETEAHRG